MRRFLTTLLLLCNLFASMAYAWDADPAASLGHGAVTASAVPFSDTATDDEDHTDDHCCHGEVHLLVLHDDSVTSASLYAANHCHLPFTSLRPLYVAPLLRPPIA